MDLTGPDGAPVLRLELAVTTHPCDLAAGARFDTQGVALGRYPNEVEPETAIAACREAVEAYPEVARLRGQLDRALVLAGRYGEGVAELEAAQERGHLASRWLLGSLLIEGRGVTADPARGVALLESAAEQGNPGAMNELGRLHLRGVAVGWYARAAEAGQPNAFLNLGRLLREGGPGLPPDPDRAAYWLAAGAERGNVWGHVQLARLQLSGATGAKDETAAARLLARAATVRLDRLPMALRSGITAAYHEEAQAAARAELAKLPQAAIVRAIQDELAACGLDPGGRDGRLGPKTKAAIAAFARSQDPPLPTEAPLWRVLGALLEPAA